MAALLALAPILYWGLGILGAGLSCLLSACKFVDWKRQKKCPSRHEYGARAGESIGDHLAALPTRDAPLMAGKTPGHGAKQQEKVAKLSDVAHLMKNGDFLWFAGRAFHSYIIRITTFSEFSHGAVLKVTKERGPEIVQVIEGKGGEIVSLADMVEKYPGQWYFGPVDRHRYKEYDGDAAVKEVEKFVNRPYGNVAIIFQIILHCPFIVALAYWFRDRTDKLFETRPPFCSGAQQLASKAGGAVLVQGRAPQLCCPQDTAQSKLCPVKVALFPG